MGEVKDAYVGLSCGGAYYLHIPSPNSAGVEKMHEPEMEEGDLSEDKVGLGNGSRDIHFPTKLAFPIFPKRAKDAAAIEPVAAASTGPVARDSTAFSESSKCRHWRRERDSLLL